MSASVRPRRARAGSWGAVWRPAALVSRDIMGIKLGLAGAAMWRSYDYATGVPSNPGVVESALPSEFWSIACLAIAWLLLYGMAARRHAAVWLAHGWGAVVYLALTVGATVNAVHASILDVAFWHSQPSPAWWVIVVSSGTVPAAVIALHRFAVPARPRGSWWVALFAFALAASVIVAVPGNYDDARYVFPLLLLCVLHFMLALRSGRVPLDQGHAAMSATVSRPEE